MGVLLSSATRKRIEKSIERPVSMELVEKYFEQESIDYIMKWSDYNCIRCWGMVKGKKELFDETEPGDSLLLSEEGTGSFTQYGLIIGKVENKRFGQTLWSGYKENVWECIYFLTNAHKIDIDKEELLFYLGEIPTIKEPIRITLPPQVNFFSFLEENEDTQQIYYPESYLNFDKQFKPIRSKIPKSILFPDLKRKKRSDTSKVNDSEELLDTNICNGSVEQVERKTAREANILIATDKEHIADELVETLIENGYKCPTVVCGDEVLDALQRGQIDILITEMVLHEISAMEIVKYKNKYSPATKIILLTKYSTEEDALDAVIEGAELYVSYYRNLEYWVSKVVWQLGLTRKRGYIASKRVRF